MHLVWQLLIILLALAIYGKLKTAMPLIFS